jgi:hypothetical protein
MLLFPIFLFAGLVVCLVLFLILGKKCFAPCRYSGRDELVEPGMETTLDIQKRDMRSGNLQRGIQTDEERYSCRLKTRRLKPVRKLRLEVGMNQDNE